LFQCGFGLEEGELYISAEDSQFPYERSHSQMIRAYHEADDYIYKPEKCRLLAETLPKSFQIFIYELEHSSCLPL